MQQNQPHLNIPAACSLSLSLPVPPPLCLSIHPASQWLEAGKDGTSKAAVSHSARLLVLRKAACCPLKWPRPKQQPPETQRRKIFFKLLLFSINIIIFLKTDPKTVGIRVAFFHTLSPFPPSTSARPARCRLRSCFLLLLPIKTRSAAIAGPGSFLLEPNLRTKD